MTIPNNVGLYYLHLLKTIHNLELKSANSYLDLMVFGVLWISLFIFMGGITYLLVKHTIDEKDSEGKF